MVWYILNTVCSVTVLERFCFLYPKQLHVDGYISLWGLNVCLPPLVATFKWKLVPTVAMLPYFLKVSHPCCVVKIQYVKNILFVYSHKTQLNLTLSVLMLQIRTVPSTAEPANVSYLQRYADLRLATLISVLCLFSAQCLNTESILKGSCVIYCL